MLFVIVCIDVTLLFHADFTLLCVTTYVEHKLLICKQNIASLKISSDEVVEIITKYKV